MFGVLIVKNRSRGIKVVADRTSTADDSEEVGVISWKRATADVGSAYSPRRALLFLPWTSTLSSGATSGRACMCLFLRVLGIAAPVRFRSQSPV